MSGKKAKFGDKNISKIDFYKNKKVTKIDDIAVNKILVSKQELHGTNDSFKYFIRYNDNDVIRPSCIKLPQMIGYVRKFEGNTTMSFKISDIKLLKKYDQIWKRVEKVLKIEFDRKPVYDDNDKYIKTKIKIYASHVITNIQGKEMKKEKHYANVYQ